MNHPVMHDVGNTQQYSAARILRRPATTVRCQQHLLLVRGQPLACTTRWVMPAVVGGTAVVALIAGVTLGAAFWWRRQSDSGNSEGPGATLSPTTGVAGGRHRPLRYAQDVSCAPATPSSHGDSYPGHNRFGSVSCGCCIAERLAENPYASPPVRAAVTDMTSVAARIAAHGTGPRHIGRTAPIHSGGA